MLQTVQRHGVYNTAHGTVHYKEPLKSFEIRVGHSPGFGLLSVAILPQCAESAIKQYLAPQASVQQPSLFFHYCPDILRMTLYFL